MKLRNIIIAIIVLGLAGLIAFRFFTAGKGEKTPSIDDVRRADGVPVDVYAIQNATFEKWLEKTGALEGINQASIYANMPARIRTVHVQQGQKVGAGRAIVSLDALSSTQSYAAREGARLQYETAKREFDRLQPLHEAGALSDSQLDRARLAMDTARAVSRDAAASLTLKTPIAGVVTDVRVRAGQKVEPGETLAVVAKTDQARVKMDVSSSDIKKIAAGQVAMVVENGDNELASGQVCCVSLSADPKTRLFLVEAILDSNGLLPPGTLQRVKIRTDFQENALQVPSDALHTDAKGYFVFVVGGENKAEKRPIVIGPHNNKMVVVEDGLQAGEQVVVWGANLLSGGEKVQIHKVVEQL
ncbi:MAG: efflux RND transporter periplasmic adaptor subunit [Candidatus Lernaella stagnicola]|nr:efflux RND transporter periplasmic adaptor subunit [Candidatus Lernaella stagnicola]